MTGFGLARRGPIDPNFEKHIQIASAWFPGPAYSDWLAWFHEMLSPQTYLEIGVETGRSLQIAQGETRAIGIDPSLGIVHPLSAWCKLFQQTSDEFFESTGPTKVFGRPTDFAFLDGLHTFDQTLRDFLNLEPHLHSDSIVLMHDIYPVIPETAYRDRITEFWVGDTWKVVPILREERPDLNVFVIPTFPSGLCVISGFGKAESLDVETLTNKWMPVDINDVIDQMGETLNVCENAEQDVVARLGWKPHPKARA